MWHRYSDFWRESLCREPSVCVLHFNHWETFQKNLMQQQRTDIESVERRRGSWGSKVTVTWHQAGETVTWWRSTEGPEDLTSFFIFILKEQNGDTERSSDVRLCFLWHHLVCVLRIKRWWMTLSCSAPFISTITSVFPLTAEAEMMHECLYCNKTQASAQEANHASGLSPNYPAVTKDF